MGHVNRRGRLLVLIAATAGSIMVPLNTSMLSVGLAPIMHDFDVPVSAVTWLVLLYLVAITSLQPTAGKLGDRFGHRRVFLTGLILFGFASLGAAVASSFGYLVMFRVLQGVLASSLGPNAAALIGLAYPAEEQGRAMGLYVGTFSMGLTVGPVISGLLVNTLGWRSIFWINLPAVVLSVWLGFRVLPRAREQVSVPFDWWGTGLFTLLVGGVVAGVNLWKGEALPVSLWWLLPFTVVVGAAFYGVEQRAVDPLIRFGLFRLPGFGAANVAVLLLHTMLYVMLVAIPLYLQEGLQLPATVSGVQMAVFSLMQVLVAPGAGRVSDLFGRRLPVVLGGGLYLVSGLLLCTLPPEPRLLRITGALILAGIGTGLTGAPVQAAALSACPPRYVGMGSGVWYSFRYLGNISGALLAGLLLPTNLSLGAPMLFGTVAAVAVGLGASALFLPARSHG